MNKILILGGGFGGVRCALELERKLSDQAQITLVDKNSYHLFLPSLYEVASFYKTTEFSWAGFAPLGEPTSGNNNMFSEKLKKTVCISFSDIFMNRRIDFMQAEIMSIDLADRVVKTKGNHSLYYDQLVIALGSQSTGFGIPGVKEYAYQFKSIEDALMVNKKVSELIEKMITGAKSGPVKILVGGGGFSGVELAAELACFVKKMSHEHNVKGKSFNITLIEASPKILPMVSDKERKMILKRLTELGVALMENSPIEEVGMDFIKLKNGQMLSGDMIIWTAGVMPNEILKLVSGLPLTQKGKIRINQYLEVEGFKNVFGIGDNVELMDSRTQKPVPGLAYVASDQGKAVARNIYDSLVNRKLRPYKPVYDVWIAPVGGKFALAHLWGGFLLNGFWGWVVRELVDLRYLTSITSIKRGITLFLNEIVMFVKND